MRFVFPNVPLDSGDGAEAVEVCSGREPGWHPLKGVVAGLDLGILPVAYFVLLGEALPADLEEAGTPVLRVSLDPAEGRIAGRSLHLASLLTLIHARKPQDAPPGLLTTEVIWASGAIKRTPDNKSVQIASIDHAPRKVAAFRNQEDARYFLLPRTTFDQLTLEGKLPEGVSRLTLKQFRERCASERNRSDDSKFLVILDADDLSSVVALICSHECSGAGADLRTGEHAYNGRSWYPRGLRRRHIVFALATATALGSVAARVAWTSRSPTTHPVETDDAGSAANTNGQPAFSLDELGIVLEEKALDRGSDPAMAFQQLKDRIQEWRSEVIARTCTQSDANCARIFVPVRLQMLSEVDDRSIRTARATVGIRGRVAYDPTTRDYYVVDPRVTLNLGAFPAPVLEGDSLIVRLPIRGSPGPWNYRGTTLELYPFTLNAMLEEPTATCKREFKARYMAPTMIPVGGKPQAIQNLNYSMFPEFGGYESPSARERVLRQVTLLKMPEIRTSDLRGLVKGVVGLRAYVGNVLRGLSSDAQEEVAVRLYDRGMDDAFREDAGAPPPLVSLYWQVRGDLAVLCTAGLRRENAAGTAAVQELRQTMRSGDFAVQLHEMYAKAVADNGGCVGCYESMAQLMYGHGDSVGVLTDLEKAADSSEGSDRAHFLIRAARYAMAVDDKRDAWAAPTLLTDHQVQIATHFLARVRAIPGYAPIAKFDEARLDLASRPDTPRAEQLLREVLHARPKHMLTRYLLTKVLFGEEASRDERFGLLDGLLADAIDSKGQYSEQLHSLGPGDETVFGVDISVIVEDYLDDCVSRCNEAAARDALTHLQGVAGVDWEGVRKRLSMRQEAVVWSLFPSTFTANGPYERSCKRFRSVQSRILARIPRAKASGN